MRSFVKVLVVILFFGCSPKIVGTYISKPCLNLGFACSTITIKSDSTFSYKFAHEPEIISGTWFVRSDTIFTKSDFLLADTFAIGRVMRLTSFSSDSDAFLFKGKYILGIGKVHDNILYKHYRSKN